MLRNQTGSTRLDVLVFMFDPKPVPIYIGNETPLRPRGINLLLRIGCAVLAHIPSLDLWFLKLLKLEVSYLHMRSSKNRHDSVV